VAEDGRLLIAYEHEGEILARAWDGSAWTDLGNVSRSRLGSQFAAASGAKIAWAETRPDATEVYFRRLK
jgi:hypothetical protein